MMTMWRRCHAITTTATTIYWYCIVGVSKTGSDRYPWRLAELDDR